MTVYLNLAGYLFADLSDLPQLHHRVLDTGAQQQLRGTVLLAPEGINLFVCAAPAAARQWLGQLRQDPRLAPLRCQESWSLQPVFERWRVKIKPQIISFGPSAIRPQDGRAATVDAATLRRWIAQGHDDQMRRLTLLDTRNQFEVRAGTFEQARHLPINSFVQFAQALETQHGLRKDDRIVTFCTGGIRCEKAALYMRERGYRDVLQLAGGVLSYFEQVGGEHWRGDLFVFDQRVALNPGLTPVAQGAVTCATDGPDEPRP